MVLDTRTLDSFYDLAAVVRDFTTPSRGGRELTREEEDQACRLRAEHGWHAWHIAEAMGLAGARNAQRWQDNIIEALEGCMYRRDWGGSRARLIRGIGRTAARGEELHPSEVTVEGPNDLGAFRRSARQNAIIEAFLTPGQTGTADLPGAGQRPRQIGRPTIKAGKDKTSEELVLQASAILANQVRAGFYRGRPFAKLYPNQVTDLIREMGDLVDWPGKGSEQVVRLLTVEERKKIDDELLRLCREQAKKTPEVPQGFYGKLREEFHRTFPCCGPDGQETMEEFGYPLLTHDHINSLCRDANIFKRRMTLKEQIADPDNRQSVIDAIEIHGVHQTRISKETGISPPVVKAILDALGYATVGSKNAAIRKIILPLHDAEKLTPSQMWDSSPELRTLIGGDRKKGATLIASYLWHSDPPREPWTIATIREDRVLPIVADNLREMLQNHLRQEAQDDVWLARIIQNVSAQAPPGGIFESLGTERELTVAGVAALLKETPAFTRKVIEVLAAETPQFVALRGEELVVPFSGLQWIVRGGE
jgi:hypothetical protein